MKNELIANYLTNKRKEAGITQKELAVQMGVTFQAVSRWENGDSIPDLGILDQLADFYNVTIDEILQRDKKKDDNFSPRWILFGMISLMYLIGLFAVAFGKDSSLPSWAETLGYGVSIFFMICGVFVQQIYYFIMSSRDKRELRVYLITYLPLLIAFVFFILIDGGIID